MQILPISEAIIRHNSNSSSYSRGEDYYRRDAVADLKKRGNLIQAAVEGSEIRPYQVSINLSILMQPELPQLIVTVLTITMGGVNILSLLYYIVYINQKQLQNVPH